MACPLCSSAKAIKLEQCDTTRLVNGHESMGVDVKRFFPSKIITLYQCVDCRLQYFDPADEGDGQYYQSLSMQPWYYMKNKYEYEYALNQIIEFKPYSILEVGCGYGYFLEKLQDSFIVRGIEQNPTALKYMEEKGIEQDDGYLTYDWIVLFQVLEHIKEIHGFVKNILSRLNKKGMLLLTTPNPDSAYMKEIFHCLDCPPHHLARWPKQTFYYLSNLFELEAIDYFTEPLSLQHFQQLFNQRRELLQNIYSKTETNKISEIDIALFSLYRYIYIIPGHTRSTTRLY